MKILKSHKILTPILLSTLTLLGCGTDPSTPTGPRGKIDTTLDNLYASQATSTWVMRKDAYTIGTNPSLDSTLTALGNTDLSVIQDGWISGDTLSLAFNKQDTTTTATLNGPSGKCQVIFTPSTQNNQLILEYLTSVGEIQGATKACISQSNRTINATIIELKDNTILTLNPSPFTATGRGTDLFILKK
jgi:hypothetical protein